MEGGAADQQKIRTFTPAGQPCSSSLLPLQYHSLPPLAFREDRPSGLAKGAPRKGRVTPPPGFGHSGRGA